MASILVIDCGLRNRLELKRALRSHEVVAAESVDAAQKMINGEAFDLVVILVGEDERAWPRLFDSVLRNWPLIPVVVVADQQRVARYLEQSVAERVEVVPGTMIARQMPEVVQRLLEIKRRDFTVNYLRHTQGHLIHSREGIIAHSDSMKRVLDQADRAATSDVAILLTGETGVGKNLVAGFVHFNSVRRDNNFVEVNCAALPETLLESELFGHERGAFTGAEKMRVGRFEQAEGGTILLDEIGEVPPAIQAKLLLILERKHLQRLGASRTIPIDVRIQAATNRDLGQAMAERTFREDLYYRINVVSIHIPPLRERRADIVPLAQHFLRHMSREMKLPAPELTPRLTREMVEYPWPGNIRHLRNLLERAILFNENGVVDSEDFWPPAEKDRSWRPSAAPAPPESLNLEENERRLIEEALRRAGGVQAEAARLLGLSKRALHYRIGKLDLRHLVEKNGAA